MTALICGSLAYDTIMSYDGRYSDALLPDQLHRVNVSFLVPTMRREFGGCAGNIAYTLKMLGGDPLIMATIGADGAPYLEHFAELEISTRNIRTMSSTFTGQCFVTTDVDGNQITAFHPGAMGLSHENTIASTDGRLQLAIVAPDGKEGMQQNARDCAERNIPLIFDPGQAMLLFDGEELKEMVGLAAYVAMNEYESELMMERTGWSLEDLVTQVEALIITHGERGAKIYAGNDVFDIPGAKAEAVLDPTGCGDAFRAGLMYGISKNMDWPTCGRIGSLMGAIKIAHQGGQNHKFTKSEIKAQFKAAFGYDYEAA